jgi:hypothetical protein
VGRLSCHRRAARGATGLLALAWLLGATALSSAQTPLSAEAIEKLRRAKAPEDWTTEERLAVRFDPGDVRLRREAARGDLMKGKADLPEVAAARAALPNPNDETNHIVGQRTPELFLPTEVFESLLKGAFSPDPQTRRVCRSTMREGLEAAGFDPETFWPALEAIAREPIRSHSEFYELALKMGKAKATERKAIAEHSGEIVARLCAPQAAALAEARKRFGRKPFDRFLYRTVAPTMFLITSPDPEWPAQLRKREGGCRETVQ